MGGEHEQRCAAATRGCLPAGRLLHHERPIRELLLRVRRSLQLRLPLLRWRLFRLLLLRLQPLHVLPLRPPLLRSLVHNGWLRLLRRPLLRRQPLLLRQPLLMRQLWQ